MNLTRCVAPVWNDDGALRCLSTRPCPVHTHRWDLLLIPLSLIWTIRPWWPTHLGRARDRGLAHTPLVRPCRACRLEFSSDCPPADVRRRHQAGTYVPGFHPGGAL